VNRAAEGDLPPCEFRLERPITGDPTGRHEIVCQTADFARLAAVGETRAALEAICRPCPIPPITADDPWACLFLRPLKVLNDEEDVVYFACRWFYKLHSRGQPTDMTFCRGCSYWFPRPPLDLIAGHLEESDAIRRYLEEGEPPRFVIGHTRAETDDSWWGRVINWLR